MAYVAGYNLFWLGIVYFCVKCFVNASLQRSIRYEINPTMVNDSDHEIGWLRRICCPCLAYSTTSQEKAMDKRVADMVSITNIYEMGQSMQAMQVKIDQQQRAIEEINNQKGGNTYE